MNQQHLISKLSSELKPFEASDSLKAFSFKWVSFTLIVLVLSYLILPTRADIIAKLTSGLFIFENILWLLVTTVSGIAFYYSTFPQLMPRSLKYPVIISLVILTAITLSHLNPENLSGEFTNEMSLWRGRCGIIILIITTLQAGLLGAWARNSAPRNLGMSGVWASLSASSLGCLFMQVVCAHENSLHLILWHFFPMILAAFAAQFMARKLLRW